MVSSALWPFSTLGWPTDTRDVERFYPTSVLVTGFDIIFFWMACMMMMGLKFAGDVPFREIYIHGLVRDHEGQKMSKSKGNVLNPLDLIDGDDLDTLVAKRPTGLMQPKQQGRIEKATRKEFPEGIPAFGTDALRFTFAALATTGRDIRFTWAASRVTGISATSCGTPRATFSIEYRVACRCTWGGGAEPGLADRWIRARFRAAMDRVAESFATYRLDLAAQAMYEFVWHEFCDWYLELAKPALQAGDEATRAATRHTLVTVLEATLRLLHPLMPFITEEIWTRVAPLAGVSGESIMLADYPVSADWIADSEAEREIGWLQQFVLGVRQIRGEIEHPARSPVAGSTQEATAEDLELLGRHQGYLREPGEYRVLAGAGRRRGAAPGRHRASGYHPAAGAHGGTDRCRQGTGEAGETTRPPEYGPGQDASEAGQSPVRGECAGGRCPKGTGTRRKHGGGN